MCVVVMCYMCVIAGGSAVSGVLLFLFPSSGRRAGISPVFFPPFFAHRSVRAAHASSLKFLRPLGEIHAAGDELEERDHGGGDDGDDDDDDDGGETRARHIISFPFPADRCVTTATGVSLSVVAVCNTERPIHESRQSLVSFVPTLFLWSSSPVRYVCVYTCINICVSVYVCVLLIRAFEPSLFAPKFKSHVCAFVFLSLWLWISITFFFCWYDQMTTTLRCL